MPAPQRLTTAQAKMIERARRASARGEATISLDGKTALERSATLRTATSLEALGLGRLVGNMPGEAPTDFGVDLNKVSNFFGELKEWQKRPRTSGKSGLHRASSRAVILRLDEAELARWQGRAAKKGQAFKAWARDAFLAHEGR